MNAIILKVRPSANLRFHKVAPEPKQLPTPALDEVSTSGREVHRNRNQGHGTHFQAPNNELA
jgi:hypothetical protein